MINKELETIYRILRNTGTILETGKQYYKIRFIQENFYITKESFENFKRNGYNFIYIQKENAWSIFPNKLCKETVCTPNSNLLNSHFIYNLPKNYESRYCIEKVSRETLNINKEYLDKVFSTYKYTELLHTFGIEFETATGTIPLHCIYENGLIPLRDGSIRGNEYSTIVYNDYYFPLLERAVKDLNFYTSYNSDCSTHIHFGGYPISKKSIWTLYKICKIIEGEIPSYTHKYVFRSDEYKSSGKNYCKVLPNLIDFDDLYRYYSEGVNYLGSFRAPHPCNVDRNRKWNIHTRYHWVNFINLLFYETNKTVEFRFLPPTSSYKEIIYWLFILNGILLYAEKVSKFLYKKIAEVLSGSINLLDILKEVYPTPLYSELSNFLTLSSDIYYYQSVSGDDILNMSGIREILIDQNVKDFTK